MSDEIETDDDLKSVLDEAVEKEEVAPVHYSITSYGVDFDVEGIVRRMRNGDIEIPVFQRSFVWNIAEASRLVESLLLGLPVPGIFLAADPETKKLLVIDGQQRLKSLLYFYQERFVKGDDSESERVFRLTKVQHQYEGLTYGELDEDARRTLDNSVLHATVIRQESPEGDDTSLFHIFERLNTGGRRLVPQEIRTAIYQGEFIALLEKLNDFAPWREIFGKKSHRLKDEELILRFLALLNDQESYSAPMTEFLSKFAKSHRRLTPEQIDQFELSFKLAVQGLYDAIGPKVFRIGRTINAAVFDSLMVALATGISAGTAPTGADLKKRYEHLMSSGDYLLVVEKATANEKSVAARIQIAKNVILG